MVIPDDCYSIISSFLINKDDLKLVSKGIYINCRYVDNDIDWYKKYTKFMRNKLTMRHLFFIDQCMYKKILAIVNKYIYFY